MRVTFVGKALIAFSLIGLVGCQGLLRLLNRQPGGKKSNKRICAMHRRFAR